MGDPRFYLKNDGDKKVTRAVKSLRHNDFTALGKDEIASSNLASSSKKSVIPTGMADFL